MYLVVSLMYDFKINTELSDNYKFYDVKETC